MIRYSMIKGIGMSSARKRIALHKANTMLAYTKEKLSLVEAQYLELKTLAESLAIKCDEQTIKLKWLPIASAPKDGKPIIGLCVHSYDSYYSNDGDTLTTYGAHAEGLGHVEDGVHVLEWGGEYSEDTSGEGYGPYISIDNWWFRRGSYFQEPANPTHWFPIPESF